MRAGVVGEITSGWRALLGRPVVYGMTQRLLGAERARRRLVAEHLRLAEGSRVLDLGCGTGAIVRSLGNVEYLGVDINTGYVEAARAEFGDRAEFLAGDLRCLDLGGRRFDMAIAMGVLHHFDDGDARRVLGVAAEALEPDGRLVSVDNVRIEGQGRFARWLIDRDRGANVRSLQGYVTLAQDSFGSVEGALREDLLRVSYPLVILDCRVPRPNKGRARLGLP